MWDQLLLDELDNEVLMDRCLSAQVITLVLSPPNEARETGIFLSAVRTGVCTAPGKGFFFFF